MQFLSVDPASSVTNQPYAYAISDPANQRDSNGLDPFDDPTEGPGPAPAAGPPGSAADLYTEAGWTQEPDGSWLPPVLANQSSKMVSANECSGASAFNGGPYAKGLLGESELDNMLAKAYPGGNYETQVRGTIDGTDAGVVMDAVVLDTQTGEYTYYDSKYGPNASPSSNQALMTSLLKQQGYVDIKVTGNGPLAGQTITISNAVYVRTG